MSITVCGQPATDVSQLWPRAATGELTYHPCFWWGGKKKAWSSEGSPLKHEENMQTTHRNTCSRWEWNWLWGDSHGACCVAHLIFGFSKNVYFFHQCKNCLSGCEGEEGCVWTIFTLISPILFSWDDPCFSSNPQTLSSGYVRAQVLS